MTGECFVYRLYDDSGALLYVGVSMRPLARIKDHLRLQPWHDEIAHHTVEGPFPTDEAVRRERVAIRDELPRYNRAVYPPRLFRREDVDAWAASTERASA